MFCSFVNFALYWFALNNEDRGHITVHCTDQLATVQLYSEARGRWPH